MSSCALAEIRTAARQHTCSCGEPIGRGDTYLRTAIPPWGFDEAQPDGTTLRAEPRAWTILTACHGCTTGVLAA